MFGALPTRFRKLHSQVDDAPPLFRSQLVSIASSDPPSLLDLRSRWNWLVLLCPGLWIGNLCSTYSRMDLRVQNGRNMKGKKDYVAPHWNLASAFVLSNYGHSPFQLEQNSDCTIQQRRISQNEGWKHPGERARALLAIRHHSSCSDAGLRVKERKSSITQCR